MCKRIFFVLTLLSYVSLLSADTIPCPSIPRPTGTTVSNITSNSATVTWTGGGQETVWNIQYQTAGDTLWTAIDSVTANTYTLLALTPNSTYNVRVQSVYDTVTSDWTDSVQFTTLCGAVATDSMPFFDDFESWPGELDSHNGVMPDCWDNYSTYYIKPHVIHSGTFIYRHSGVNSLGFYGRGSNYAILPLFETPINQLEISFWRQMEVIHKGTLTLGYITSNDNGMNTFTPIKTIPSNVNSMQFADIALNRVPSNAYKLVFKWSYQYNAVCCIDDITVSLLPPCIKPDTFTITDVAATTASLAWVARGDETKWNVRYKPANDSVWAMDTFQTTPTGTITSLLDNTLYQVQVRSDCDSCASEWTDTLTFTTLCLPVDPAVLGQVGFETGEGFTTGPGNLANCWMSGNIKGATCDHCIPFVKTGDARTGNNCLFIEAYYYYSVTCQKAYDDDSAYVIMPEMSFSESITDYRVEFYMRKRSNSGSYYVFNDTLWIGVVADPGDLSTLQIVGHAIHDRTTYGWRSVSLASYTGGANGRIVFLATAPDRNVTSTDRLGSFYIDDVIVSPLRYNIIRDTAYSCEGQAYTWRGKNLTESGVYADTVRFMSGNDAIYELTLMVYPTYITTDSATLPADSAGYMWHGKTYYEAGDYYDTLKSTQGCDSVCVLHLAESIPAGINSLLASEISLLPNPVECGNTAYIEADWSDSQKEGMVVEVFTLWGELVARFKPGIFPIAIPGINAPGTYLIRVTPGSGDTCLRKLIVK